MYILIIIASEATHWLRLDFVRTPIMLPLGKYHFILCDFRLYFKTS